MSALSVPGLACDFACDLGPIRGTVHLMGPLVQSRGRQGPADWATY